MASQIFYLIWLHLMLLYILLLSQRDGVRDLYYDEPLLDESRRKRRRIRMRGGEVIGGYLGDIQLTFPAVVLRGSGDCANFHNFHSK